MSLDESLSHGTTVAPIIGQYMHPIIEPGRVDDDPWERKYFVPPKFSTLVPRSAPLIDIRPLLERPEGDPQELIKTHGFGVVKHSSTLLRGLGGGSDLSHESITDIYHPEIRELVLSTLGAKKLFILASVVRRGEGAPHTYKPPTEVTTMAASASVPGPNKDNTAQNDDRKIEPRPIGLAAPVRMPHLDFTPLGARQVIRSQGRDIHDAAMEAGVITAEDAICNRHSVRAATKDADSAIANEYNTHNSSECDAKLGPRYAAFSIWRPLKMVGRDPITLCPRKETGLADSNHFVHWPYHNKIPGPQDMGGDFIKEYGMLGVRQEEPPAQTMTNAPGSDSLKWYYISQQQPDEVLFIKLFDSASLGANSDYTGAPWHASPEVGTAAGDQPRESIDVRVLVFW